MTTTKTDVLIIGAGLTGLTLAYRLKNLNINVKLIEARDRLGGRIYSIYNTNEAPLELGATWIVEQQKNILQLLNELNLSVFEQDYGSTAIYQPNPNQKAQLVDLPTHNSVSYRIKNGTQSIISALAEKLLPKSIEFNQKIESIQKNKEGLLVKTINDKYQASHVVSTLPPLLFSKNITTEPTLPNSLLNTMQNTHTWMHNSIRVGFTYKKAFWKADKTSGTIYANAGPLQEIYDHSDAENSVYALAGFMNNGFTNYSKEERKVLALQQLQAYYGDQALKFDSYEECVWLNETFTTIKSDSFLMPQQNNGHPIYQDSYLEDSLFIAGTETSPVFSGKMEGAIISANIVYNKLKDVYRS